MSISPKNIQGKLVTKVQELVKGEIWEYSNGNPAVFKSNAFNNKTPPSPKMPYISIDFAQTQVPFLDVKYEGWLSDTEYGVLESKIMQFVITVYGSGGDDTLHISSSLATRLKASYNRDYFHQLEVGLYNVTNPVTSNLRLSDQYRDVSSFTLSLSYVDRVIDTVGGGCITSVNIDTETYKDEEGEGGLYKGLDDTSPIPIQTGDIPENNN